MPSPIEYFRSVVVEGRMTQNTWHKESNGKHYMCLAAAWGAPGTINSTSDCPTTLFPHWVFAIMPTLNDGIAPAEVRWLFEGFGRRADKMSHFTFGQWLRVRQKFLLQLVDLALVFAGAVKTKSKHWEATTRACTSVKKALYKGSRSELKEAAAAARIAAALNDVVDDSCSVTTIRAARAAQYAADTAAYATSVLDAATAYAIDAASRAAFHAAKDVASGIPAANEARRQVAALLFTCIDEEVGA